MSEPDSDTGDDPGEVEPTDNSTGAPVDLDALNAIEQQQDERHEG